MCWITNVIPSTNDHSISTNNHTCFTYSKCIIYMYSKLSKLCHECALFCLHHFYSCFDRITFAVEIIAPSATIATVVIKSSTNSRSNSRSNPTWFSAILMISLFLVIGSILTLICFTRKQGTNLLENVSDKLWQRKKINVTSKKYGITARASFYIVSKALHAGGTKIGATPISLGIGDGPENALQLIIAEADEEISYCDAGLNVDTPDGTPRMSRIFPCIKRVLHNKNCKNIHHNNYNNNYNHALQMRPIKFYELR